jgi:AraC-like DNA-binding protein
MFVIRFRVGAAARFLPLPVGELTGQVLEADVVFGTTFNALREALLEGPTPAAKFQAAEAYLYPLLNHSKAEHPAIAWALARIQAAPATATVDEIVRRTGYSHKHLVNLFRQQVGLTPKELLRVLRFQHTVHSIETQPGLRWSQLAADCGFYDQAHLIQEFRAFSGFTPGEYFAHRGEYLNYLPVG